MGETIIKKPLNEYKLTQNTSHSKKGHKGFIRVENKKEFQVKIVVDKNTKSFLDEYCETARISKTQLIMGALECYTGFNGDNGNECIQMIKTYINEGILPIGKE
jgi:hypothetical protein